jgi:hypothetical protein
MRLFLICTAQHYHTTVQFHDVPNRCVPKRFFLDHASLDITLPRANNSYDDTSLDDTLECPRYHSFQYDASRTKIRLIESNAKCRYIKIDL